MPSLRRERRKAGPLLAVKSVARGFMKPNKPNTMNDFISAETLTALIAHMNTTVTEADFVGEDEEEESTVATSTSPIEEALGYTYDNRVQGSLQYA